MSFLRKKRSSLVPEPPRYSSSEEIDLDKIAKPIDIGEPSALHATRYKVKTIVRKEEEHPKPSKKEIYVKIDNFKNVLSDLDTIAKNMDEMDSIISELKDLKTKEDEEIGSWEQEIHDLKNRLMSIHKNLSEKI
ncbi:MAG: hypothetical protein ABH817_00925 [archaeon]